MNARVVVHCAVCNELVERSSMGMKASNGITFCNHPKYCRYEFQLKNRDPKGYKILEHVNTSDFYYFIGLICTDGNITYPRPELRHSISYSCHISLNKKDRYLLKQIQNQFGGILYDGRTDNTTEWFISHKGFVEYLQNTIGLTHNKSKTLDVERFFNSIPDNYKQDFLRGVIDGDGSIKQYRASRVCSICSGSKSFIDMLQQWIVKRYNTQPSFQNLKGCYYIVLSGRKMLPMLNDIYQNIDKTSLYLKRKYDTYTKIRKHYYSTYTELVTLNLGKRLPCYALLKRLKDAH